MKQSSVIGIDMGGTQLRGGVVRGNEVSGIVSASVHSEGSVDQVLEQLFALVQQLLDPSVKGIGIGVPGLVSMPKGVVYDVVNIASWKEVPLKQLMEDRFQLPIKFENDANCFALGEYWFGKGKGHDSMLGLTIGTGLGSGIILNKKLYAGRHGGAGEFGMIEYLDKYYEYYASGQFFQNVYERDGREVFRLAKAGDKKALAMYEEMGSHLGNAIRTILYTLDIDLIVLGGSVRHALPYFSESMWQQIRTFAFQRAADDLRIEVSELENSGILGAAALLLEDVQ